MSDFVRFLICFAYNWCPMSDFCILFRVFVQKTGRCVIVYILILLVFVYAKFNFDKWIFLDALWIPT